MLSSGDLDDSVIDLSSSLAVPDSHPRRQEWRRTDAVRLPPARFSSSITFTLSKCKRKPSIFHLSFPFTHPSYASWIYTSILFIYFMKMFLKSLCVQFLMSFFLCVFCQLTLPYGSDSGESGKIWKRINMFLLSQIFLIKTQKIKKRAATTNDRLTLSLYRTFIYFNLTLGSYRF